MATVTTFQDDTFPSWNSGIASVQKVISLANGDANSGDYINVLAIPPGAKGRLYEAAQRVSASLGAGATVQLMVNRSGTYTAIAAASTAAAASKTTAAAQTGVPFDLEGGDIIVLAVAGANITASADVTVDLAIADRL